MSQEMKFDSPYGVKITLYKINNTKNYYYYFRYDKRPYRGSCKTDDIKKSKIYASELLYQVVHGVEPVKKRTKPHKRTGKTFSEMVDFYLEKVEDTLTPHGYKMYCVHSRFLKEYFGAWRESDFMERDNDFTVYVDYQNWRRDYWLNKDYTPIYTRKINGVEREVKGRNHKNMTVGGVTLNRECVLFGTIIGWLQRNEHVLRNYTVPEYSDRNRVRIFEHPRIIFPEPHEYDMIKEYFRKQNKPIYVEYIRLLSSTGMRPNEIRKLRRSDLNYKNQCLNIVGRKTKTRKVDTAFPMIGKVRDIIDSVIELTEESRQKTGEDTLFICPHNGTPIGNIRTAFKTCMARLGLNEKYSLGGFRHLFAVKMIKQASMPLYILSGLMGHSDTKMVQRNYAKYRVSDGIETMNRVYREIAEKRVKYREEGFE